MSLKRLAKSFQPKGATSEKVAGSFDVPRPLPFGAPHTDDSSSFIYDSRPQNDCEEPQESYQDDEDVLADDITITEGGWICRVERFEKHVDSRGQVHYKRPPKETVSSFSNRDLASSQELQNLQENKVKKKVQQSVISYVYFTTRASSSGLFEPEASITIKSPLILENLRENASYDQEVRPQYPYCSQHRTYH